MCKEKQWNGWLLLLLMMDSSLSSEAQLSSCVNADFELGNFVNWTATRGSCCPVNSTTPGVLPGRHTIMTGAGTDPNTNGAIKVVAPGGQYSARLGNSYAGSQSEQLSYQITVDSGNTLFIYRYAVVLEDPGHSAFYQPRFQISISDTLGSLLGCGTYNVYASAGIPGFVTLLNQYGEFIRYKDWTTVGIDLSPYIGQMVTIKFTTNDCGHGAHYGYAYVDCFSSPLRIVNNFCHGSGPTTLIAPIGFASYIWNTGATTQSILIPNAATGSQYQCTMTSVTGCTVTLTSILTETVIASAYSLPGICINPVQFTDSSIVLTGTPITQWQWDFGDGTSSSLQHPLHTYNVHGNYAVTLVVTDTNGCKDSTVHKIVVGNLPASQFTASVVCQGSATYFTDLSTSFNGSIVSWLWNFGDGTLMTSTPNPTHTYQTQGTYAVELIVIDSLGCKDTLVLPATVKPGPVSGFYNTIACENSLVYFVDTSVAMSTVVSGWEWNFGDGSPLVIGNDVPTHLFNHSGSYTVSLVTSTSNGCTDTARSPIVVHPLPVLSFHADTVCYGDQTLFQNNSTIASGNVTMWNWDFGDDDASGEFEPRHAYLSTGSFPVTLVATSDMGCVDTSFRTAYVCHVPQPDFLVSDSIGCRTLSVQFKDHSNCKDGLIVHWEWNFGNGWSATSPVADTQYPEAGKYDVSLSVRSSYGCMGDTIKDKFITSLELPLSSFLYTPQEFNLFNATIDFFDQSVNAARWWWDFGDSSASILQYPRHMFTNSGNYTVSLIVESPEGCRDTSWEVLEVTENYAFWIPNAFTPNGDGMNDLFFVNGFGYSGLSINVFNREGTRIYHNDVNSEGWNGRYNGEDAPAGVYVYLVEMTDLFGNPHTYTGHLTLLR